VRQPYDDCLDLPDWQVSQLSYLQDTLFLLLMLFFNLTASTFDIGQEVSKLLLKVSLLLLAVFVIGRRHGGAATLLVLGLFVVVDAKLTHA
jgi:hypothetical protein